MNSRLPQPGPDWKTDPRSFILAFLLPLPVAAVGCWLSGHADLVMSLPYTEIELTLGGLGILVLVAMIGYLRWQSGRPQQGNYRPSSAVEFPPLVRNPESRGPGRDQTGSPFRSAGLDRTGWPDPAGRFGEPTVAERLRALNSVPRERDANLDFTFDHPSPSRGNRPDGQAGRVRPEPPAPGNGQRQRGPDERPAPSATDWGSGTSRATPPQPSQPPKPGPSSPRPVLEFQESGKRTRPVSLTLEQLQRLLFISGRPGCGKTTILRAIARAAQGPRLPGAPACHTVTLDANRSLAEYVALESLRAGREPIVLELGARDHLVPYQFPRPGLGGDEAAAEAIRRAWFSFDREIPAQLRDAIVHDFRLLAASGYGFDQCLRVLVSESFRDEVLRLGQARLSHHTGAWLALTSALPRTEWYRKFSSTLARLFQLLENDATRLALAGRGAFSFERLNDRDYTGPGLDIIVTATGQMDDELIYFVFGILFSELASVLRARLEGAADGRWPEIVILADELGRYGGAEAILDLLSSGRNVRVKVAAATHSLMSLPEGLRTLIPVLAVNRIAGGEVGQGAALAAGHLLTYQPDLLKALGPDGKPATYWSAEEQLREFQDWLQQAPDHEFAVRLSGQKAVVRGRALADAGLFPDPRELSRALAEAAARSGRSVADIRRELQEINHDLDNRFRPIDYRAEAAPSVDDSDWRELPDDGLPHI